MSNEERLREALKIATDALYNAGIEVFPSRQGHHKRDGASRANSIILEAQAQLNRLNVDALSTPKPAPEACPHADKDGLCYNEDGSKAYSETPCPIHSAPAPAACAHCGNAEEDHPAQTVCVSFVNPAPAAERDGWRPIETAPKDGTAFMAGWAGVKAVEKMAWVCGRFKRVNSNEPPPPTHWMPLPPPPAPDHGGKL